MKKMLTMALLLCALGFTAQTAKAEESWGMGIFSEYTTPADFTIPNAKKSGKVGKAECKMIFFVSVGDCSITSAMKNGGISTVSYADWDKFSVLAVYNKKTLKVYGY